MIENVKKIEKEEVEDNVKEMLAQGYRLITMTCVDREDHFNIFYHFAKDYEIQNFKIKIAKDEEINSISNIYFSAMLVENEIKDLFGVKINGIVIDYDGRLLLSEGAPNAPMCNNGQIEIEVRGEKDGK